MMTFLFLVKEEHLEKANYSSQVSRSVMKWEIVCCRPQMPPFYIKSWGVFNVIRGSCCGHASLGAESASHSPTEAVL